MRYPALILFFFAFAGIAQAQNTDSAWVAKVHQTADSIRIADHTRLLRDTLESYREELAARRAAPIPVNQTNDIWDFVAIRPGRVSTPMVAATIKRLAAELSLIEK